MYDIITLGCPVVELLRTEKDVSFDQSGAFLGPFPSGDTCITINVAGKLGAHCGYIGVAGGDDFGKLVLARMRANGVDTSLVRVDGSRHTGVVFVMYDSSGGRKFLNTYPDSAGAGILPGDAQAEALQNTRWIHLSGVMLWMNQNARDTARFMLDNAPPDVKISFDPNYRPETMADSEIREVFEPFFQRADLIFPSENEARFIMGGQNDDEVCRRWAGEGKTAVLKQGPKGCTVYSGGEILQLPTYDVQVVDVTGCGDSFCAGFLVGQLKGLPLADCARLANATGSLQATMAGPMEGAFNWDYVQDFMAHTPVLGT